MPRGDRTGRSGMGPMAGRGMGFCAGYDVPGYANTGFGRGFGYGMGRGMDLSRGFGRGTAFRSGAGPYQADPAASQKAKEISVKRDIGILERELSSLKEQLASLSKEQES